MRKFMMISILFLLVIGCAAQTPKVQEYNNPRIIYRDLTQPLVSYAPETPQAPVLAEKKKPADKVVGNKPIHFVEFGNDSYNSFDEHQLLAFASKTPVDSTILVLGHSHGNSAVGTRSLASKRAETVLRYLKGKGYENVLVMATWGGKIVPFAPSRGVQLYILDAGKENELVSIAFMKTIKKEEHNGSPEMDNLADCSSAQRNLGDG